MKQFWTFELHYKRNGNYGVFEVKPEKINSAVKYLHELGCENITPKRKYYSKLVISRTLPSDYILFGR